MRHYELCQGTPTEILKCAHRRPRPWWRWLQLQPSCGSPQWESPFRIPSLMTRVMTPLQMLILEEMPVLMKLASRRTKGCIMDERSKLKNNPYIQDNISYAVYIGVDLTKRRATMAFRARKLRGGLIQDTWVMNCKIWVKDNRGRITQIYVEDDSLLSSIHVNLIPKLCSWMPWRHAVPCHPRWQCWSPKLI